MNRLFLRIYLPLAATTLVMLLVAFYVSFRIIPHATGDYYRQLLVEFRELIIARDADTGPEIRALAESLGLAAEVVELHGPAGMPSPPPRPGHIFLPGLPAGWRTAVEVPLLPVGRGGLQRLVFWVFLLLLVVSAAVVLMLSLRPLRRRMGRLERVVGDLASGNLSARVPTVSPGDLVDSLGVSFNRMADRIQALVASHQELLGMVAHEIRTPLARMRFAMELLKDSGDPGDARITRMERDLESLDSMLAELLAFNRLSRAEEPLRSPAELAELATEAFALESWRDRGVEVSVEGSAVVGCDRAMLLRALSNLVRNALAFASSRVRIRMERTGGEAVVTVEDDGPGFDPSVAGRLGKAFVKHADSPGSGLGLAMVERIAALHGGRVEYGKAHGGGALVRLVLPAAD